MYPSPETGQGQLLHCFHQPAAYQPILQMGFCKSTAPQQPPRAVTHGLIFFLMGQTSGCVTGSCTSSAVLLPPAGWGVRAGGHRPHPRTSHQGVMYLSLPIMTGLNITQHFAKIITPTVATLSQSVQVIRPNLCGRTAQQNGNCVAIYGG